MIPTRFLVPACALLGAWLTSVSLIHAQTTVDNAVTPTLGAFDTTGNNLTLSGTATGTASGVISGSGSLTKSGNGTWTLSANNTFTGTTTVSGGTLQIGAGGTTGSIIGNILNNAALSFNRSDALTYAGVISGTGSLTTLGTGTTTLTGNNTYTGATTISAGTLQIGNGSTAGSVTGNIANSAALTFNRSDALTYAGVISGTGSFNKTGAGTLTLSGANTYTGTTTVSAGTLSFTGSGGLASSAVTVNSGATVFAGNFGSYTIGSIAGAGAVSFSSGTLNAGGNNASTTFSGSIAGSGTLVKTGTGTLTFNGSAPAGSQLAVSGGTLLFAPSAAANFTASVLVQSGGTAIIAPPDPSRFIRHVTVYSGGSATIALPNSTPLGTTEITVNSGGAFTLEETYKTTALSNTKLAVSSGASLSLPGEGLVLGGLDNFGGGAITITPTGTWFMPNLTIGANNLSSAFGGTLTFTGATFGFYIRKIGTGTWTLLSTPNFAPIVQVGYVALSNTSAGTGIQLQGGGLRYDTAMTHTGGIASQTGGGMIDLGSNNVTLSGALSGGSSSAADTLNKIGAGTLTLTGSSTNFLGQLAINAGTVSVSTSANLGATSGEFTSSVGFGGGTLATTANFTSEHPIALNAGGGTLNVASATTLTWNGAITGASGNSLTKTGAGTLVLTAANTYAGGTTISFGIVATGSTTALGTGPVAVSAAGAILALNGTLLTNTVSVTNGGTLSGSGGTGTLSASSGGTISPGNSPGLLSAGTTTFGPGGSYIWEINDAASPATSSGTRYDLLSISGSLTITATSGSPFAINLASLLADNSPGNVINFNSSVNSSYTIATASSGITGFSSSAFTLNTSSFSNALNGGSWSIGTANSGQDLNLTFTASAIPKPSTYAAIFGTLALALAAYRRRQKL
ncbi:MAG: autotransporter-associated beta strand repeat-containing protein [Undibacterium sp.]|nr:autotransporter-associated beta strand repeat-containing protein [Opitutaceae bacterium]